jgi:hypothetical protein
MSDNTNDDSASNERRPFQYSLKTLLIATTVVATICAGLFTGPEWTRLLTLLIWLIIYPSALVAMVIYGRNYMRTFAIGLLIGSGPIIVIAIIDIRNTYCNLNFWTWEYFTRSLSNIYVGYRPRIYIISMLFSGILAGIVIVVTRRLIESSRKKTDR